MKSIIVDDELKSAESLKILLTDFCDNVQVVSICQNINDALKAIEESKPDVVFLDINLQRETGFDLFDHFTNISFSIIFTTAFSEYAIKAFRYAALDYLLKPIDIEELREAVKKADARVATNLNGQLENLFHDLKSKKEEFLKLALPTLEGLVFINVDDIIYCEASSNYTVIFLSNNQKHIVSRSLKEYDDLLSERNFFRIHSAYLVSLKAIKKYIKGDGGYVVLDNNVSLDVSKRKKAAFLARIGAKA